MPTTLTLKNIPDEVYDRLKAAAGAHRRSLNSEAIVCLEAALLPTRRITVEERIQRIRALRTELQRGRTSATRTSTPSSARGGRDRGRLEHPRVSAAAGRSILRLLRLCCRADPDWAAPLLWRSEFRNVLAGYLRRGALTLDQACRIQDETEDLMRGTEYEVDSVSVLRLLPDCGCSAYDCEYVALATKLGVSLVTRDKQVLRAFPGVAATL